VKWEYIDPQPESRLLPYSDPVDGVYWHCGDPDNRATAPSWAYRCVKPSELTAAEILKIDPGMDDLMLCSGPGCPGGPNGCNAMGCDGIREHFCSIVGDSWIWVSHESVR